MIQAQLFTNGSGIEETWPTMPGYFCDHEMIQGLEGTGVCERTVLRHSTWALSERD